MDKNYAILILESANIWLSKHELYETWMRFDGAIEQPVNTLNPKCRFSPPEGVQTSLTQDQIKSVYDQVWRHTLSLPQK